MLQHKYVNLDCAWSSARNVSGARAALSPADSAPSTIPGHSPEDPGLVVVVGQPPRAAPVLPDERVVVLVQVERRCAVVVRFPPRRIEVVIIPTFTVHFV